MKPKIVLASGNKKKLKEIREMLPEYEVIPCAELGITHDIEENGTTFYENALIKAKTVSVYYNKSNCKKSRTYAFII